MKTITLFNTRISFQFSKFTIKPWMDSIHDDCGPWDNYAGWLFWQFNWYSSTKPKLSKQIPF